MGIPAAAKSTNGALASETALIPGTNTVANVVHGSGSRTLKFDGVLETISETNSCGWL